MSRPKKINIEEQEITTIMENKTHVFVRTVSKDNTFTPTGAVPAEAMEKDLDAWKAQGYKILLASVVNTVPEGYTLLFILERE